MIPIKKSVKINKIKSRSDKQPKPNVTEKGFTYIPEVFREDGDCPPDINPHFFYTRLSSDWDKIFKGYRRSIIPLIFTENFDYDPNLLINGFASP